jgi:hypothetical protein
MQDPMDQSPLFLNKRQIIQDPIGPFVLCLKKRNRNITNVLEDCMVHSTLCIKMKQKNITNVIQDPIDQSPLCLKNI